ncbi:Transcription factor GRAS [Macleaya cordata]|uniref:Transcription factor GRAS n=1 Tax=Macleaya cordata TaxID=56857 RepID=A0A200QH69_MACCD|nr:Transcription factor GRAS [Macleaya cordata]
MRGMPFTLQGNKGVFELSEISSISSPSSVGNQWKKETGFFLGSEKEPTSVLDSRRSPSTPTSTSTLSSSFGGGCGSTDTASVAAVSDNNPLQKWPPTQEDNSTAAAAVAEPPGTAGSGGGGNRKDEWASELQPIPTGLEIVNGGGGSATAGAEKYGGLGMEDWDSMLSETAASPSLLRWIIDDVEDPSSGLLQGVGPGSEFDGNAGFGIVDPGFGFESMGGNTGSGTGPGSGMSMNFGGGGSSLGGVPGSGFPSNGRILNSIQNPSSSLSNFNKIPPPIFNSTQSTNPSSNPVFSSSPNNLPLPLSLPPGVFFQNQFEVGDEKPQLFNPPLLMNQTQTQTQNQNQNQAKNTPFFVPLPFTQQQDQNLFPQLKRHQVDPSCQIQKPTFMDSGQELFLRRQQQNQQHGFPHQLQLLPNHLQQRPPLMVTKPKLDEQITHQQHNQHQQQQALVDQLFKAAELVETGNSVLAQGILARLNHQLSHPIGKPLHRAAFYFKEALLQLLNGTPNSPPNKNSTPFDVVLKIGAYKSFSEISPLLQFSNFTCNQALLEALDGSDYIHIIDFDIGIGGQWASFMQEIAMKMGGAPSLKITAFASLSSNDNPLELALTKEHLTHFANDLGISFEIDIVRLDTLDPSSWSLPIHVSESEAVAVNLPVGSSSISPSSTPLLLRLVKQLSPKIVVSVDRGCDRSDLPFSHHFLQALQSYSILLDSLDATNANSDAINKIERFLLQPRIESTVLRRHRSHEKLPPWRSLFASAGFSPLTFSNFTETQAECLVKRLQGRGFHVEKRQASLVLCWQRRELVSASAWRC